MGGILSSPGTRNSLLRDVLLYQDAPSNGAPPSSVSTTPPSLRPFPIPRTLVRQPLCRVPDGLSVNLIAKALQAAFFLTCGHGRNPKRVLASFFLQTGEARLSKQPFFFKTCPSGTTRRASLYCRCQPPFSSGLERHYRRKRVWQNNAAAAGGRQAGAATGAGSVSRRGCLLSPANGRTAAFF